MEEQDWLAERFEENRTRLRAVAYRMLGSTGEADDAVQEAWLRLSRSDAGGITNLEGWLTPLEGRGAPGRGPGGHACARPDRGPRGRDQPRVRGAGRRLGRARAARSAR